LKRCPAPSSCFDRQLDALKEACRRAARAKRLQVFAGAACLLILIGLSAIEAEVDPNTFLAKIGGFTSYFDRMATLDSGARVWTDPAAWFWSFKRSARLLGETILMAYVGTLTGAIAALALNFVASPISPGERGSCSRRAGCSNSAAPSRTSCSHSSSLSPSASAPLQGVLALALHTSGALGKQFFETTENIDMKPVEGLRAVGASYVQVIHYAALPQVLASFASFALLRFEINVRAATVLGFVAAGGIGQDLMEAIRKFYYSDVSAILVLIIAVVMTIDISTQYLRRALLTEDR
jgi:phosphonate transport system permease protein